jgi:hypothetical protein
MDNLNNLNDKNNINITTNNSNYIYKNLIDEFENRFLNEKHKFIIFDYLRNYCDENYTNDIIIIIEDYNNIITQSIQAIKTLLCEKERLEDQNTIIIENYKEILNKLKNDYYKDIDNMKNKIKELNNEKLNNKNENELDKNKLKKPIRGNYKSNSKEKTKNEILKNSNNNIKRSLRMTFNKQIPNLSNLEYNNFQNVNPNNNNKYTNQEIQIIKITNEILKSIDKMNEIKDFLVKKYINSSSLDYNKDYKDFLNKLINYQFDVITLKNILSDVKNKNNLSKIQEELNNEYQSNQLILNTPNLINYNSSYSLLNRPPFINATNPYGRLFSEKNKIK